jgi:hypothetical protein
MGSRNGRRSVRERQKMMQRVMRGGGFLAASLLTIFGLIHVWWAARGMSEGSAVLPVHDGRPVLRPSRVASLGVAGCLFAGALTVLARLGMVRLPGRVAGVLPAHLRASLPRRGAWMLAVVFGLRAVGDFRYVGLFKRVTGTRFARWDTRLFVPLCVVVATGSALAATSERPV